MFHLSDWFAAAMRVAPSGSLLYRRLTVGRPSVFKEVVELIAEPADYQSAIQQTASLRYRGVPSQLAVERIN